MGGMVPVPFSMRKISRARPANFFRQFLDFGAESESFRPHTDNATLDAMRHTVSLRNCPFCDGPAAPAIGLNGDGSQWFYVECPTCAVGADLEVWNNRPPPAPPRPPKPARREPNTYYEGAHNDRSLTPEARSSRKT